jgi:hypothetical protein
MRSSARELATRGNDRECLALREQAVPKEGDAFLARLCVRNVVLLMAEGLYRTCSLGMRLPYDKSSLRLSAKELATRGDTGNASPFATGLPPKRATHSSPGYA